MKNKFLHITFSLFIFLFSFFYVSSVSAQTTTDEVIIATVSPIIANNDKSKKFGVTFPITELNNCVDLESCREFCNDKANHTACINYAQKKGFYNGNEEAKKRLELLKKAKKELNCDGEKCRVFCSMPENVEKCKNFSKKILPAVEEKRLSNNQAMLTAAKEVLGCDSIETCKMFCSQEANKQTCMDFFKQFKVLKVRPNLVQGAKNYCQANPGKCRPKISVTPALFNRANYCKEHPEECSRKITLTPIIQISEGVISQ